MLGFPCSCVGSLEAPSSIAGFLLEEAGDDEATILPCFLQHISSQLVVVAVEDAAVCVPNSLESHTFLGFLFPKNLLRLLFFASKNIFSEVVFRDPQKIPFKTSIKITSRGYFYFLRLFLPREAYFQQKMPQKILRVSEPRSHNRNR